eukprot:scaffold13895_cov104-Skeletonema_dohrnii-CCMP3373.AAC.2
MLLHRRTPYLALRKRLSKGSSLAAAIAALLIRSYCVTRMKMNNNQKRKMNLSQQPLEQQPKEENESISAASLELDCYPLLSLIFD